MTTRNIALGELFRIGSSKRVLKSQWKTEGVPFYRGREITRLSTDGFVNNELFISESDYAEYAVKSGVPTSGDIVITAIGTIGNSYIVREGDRFYFKDASVLWFKKETELSSEFINLWLKSSLFFDQLDKGNGATVDTLTIKKLQSVRVDLPPLPEQKRIVAILDQAFAAIDAAVANTEKNLANARELFESYLNGVFTRKGDGWLEKTLSDVCDLISGQHIDSKDYNTDGVGIGYLTGPSDFGAINPTVTKWTEVPKRTALCGDILITVKGSGVGKINLLNHEELAISRQLMAVRAKGAKTEFLYDFLSLQFSYFQSLANGAAIPGISRSDVLDLKLSMPKLSEQEKIVAAVDEYKAETQRLETIYQQKLTALAELKQSILQKAFVGELTTQPEKSLEEAVA